MTNADKIRSMTDKELAEWLCDTIDPECNGCPAYGLGMVWNKRCGWCDDGYGIMLEWLRSEADD